MLFLNLDLQIGVRYIVDLFLKLTLTWNQLNLQNKLSKELADVFLRITGKNTFVDVFLQVK